MADEVCGNSPERGHLVTAAGASEAPSHEVAMDAAALARPPTSPTVARTTSVTSATMEAGRPLVVADIAAAKLQIAVAVARACLVIDERCGVARRSRDSAPSPAEAPGGLNVRLAEPDAVHIAVQSALDSVAMAYPFAAAEPPRPSASKSAAQPGRLEPTSSDEQVTAVRQAMAAMRASGAVILAAPRPADAGRLAPAALSAQNFTPDRQPEIIPQPLMEPVAPQAAELPPVLVLADLLATVGRAPLQPAPSVSPPEAIQLFTPTEPTSALPPKAQVPSPLLPQGVDLPSSAVRVGRTRVRREPWSGQITAPEAHRPGATGATWAAAVTPPPTGPEAAPLPPIPFVLPPPRQGAGPALTLPAPVAQPSAPVDARVATPSPWRRLMAMVTGITLVVLRLTIIASLAAAIFWSLSLLAYRQFDPPFSTLMLGHALTGRPVEQRWVPLQRISPNLIRAVIASEDGNFCRHRGVDWGAINEAMGQAAEEGGRPRGASTISMQTVKNLLLWPQSHYLRKILELPLAYLAELAWGKRRILELYLNIAEWGPGIFGVEAASHYHFRKSAASLNVREAALLAVSLPNPIERNAGAPGPGMQRLGQLIERRAARPTLALGCLGVLGSR